MPTKVGIWKAVRTLQLCRVPYEPCSFVACFVSCFVTCRVFPRLLNSPCTLHFGYYTPLWMNTCVRVCEETAFLAAMVYRPRQAVRVGNQPWPRCNNSWCVSPTTWMVCGWYRDGAGSDPYGGCGSRRRNPQRAERALPRWPPGCEAVSAVGAGRRTNATPMHCCDCKPTPILRRSCGFKLPPTRVLRLWRYNRRCDQRLVCRCCCRFSH